MNHKNRRWDDQGEVMKKGDPKCNNCHAHCFYCSKCLVFGMIISYVNINNPLEVTRHVCDTCDKSPENLNWKNKD